MVVVVLMVMMMIVIILIKDITVKLHPFLTSTLEVSGKLCALVTLYLWGKSPQFLLNCRPGGPQSRCGCFGEEASCLC
jgi:hypothetical protein